MSLRNRDRHVIWHPYTPVKQWPESIGIVGGKGALLVDEEGREYIDAVSSWWVNLHGHAHPYIAQQVSKQLHTLEHCIFAGFTHEPAVSLAERLLPLLPGDMKKAFYSDNGSTAVEVAIKMALQYWSHKGSGKKRIAVLENAYHGDTFGAMSVSGRGLFTRVFEDKLFDTDVVPFPFPGREEHSLRSLETILEKGDTAALLVEPLVQGTAGMQMYSADILEEWFRMCKKYGTLVIADEVMTGFGRTGSLFACDQVNTGADIICLSKGLTGGTMPLGLTATTAEVFEAFHDDDRNKTLYHGHSFTGNPLACTAALASLDLLLADDCRTRIAGLEKAHSGFAEEIRGSAVVSGLRQKGTILAIDIKSGESPSYTHPLRDRLYRYFLGKNILMRPLGNIIYLLPPYCISREQLQAVYSAITELLDKLEHDDKLS